MTGSKLPCPIATAGRGGARSSDHSSTVGTKAAAPAADGGGGGGGPQRPPPPRRHKPPRPDAPRRSRPSGTQRERVAHHRTLREAADHRPLGHEAKPVEPAAECGERAEE